MPGLPCFPGTGHAGQKPGRPIPRQITAFAKVLFNRNLGGPHPCLLVLFPCSSAQNPVFRLALGDGFEATRTLPPMTCWLETHSTVDTQDLSLALVSVLGTTRQTQPAAQPCWVPTRQFHPSRSKDAKRNATQLERHGSTQSGQSGQSNLAVDAGQSVCLRAAAGERTS